MSVFQKVTLQSLKKNKTRTIVTIIGILLSAAMICAVTTFASSILNYALETAIYNDGSWHGVIDDADTGTYDTVVSSGKLDAITAIQKLGYARLEGCRNEEKPYLYVLGGDSQTQDLLPIHITGGRFPASPTEILLPEHLLTNGGLEYQIGDTLELSLGQRISGDMVLDPWQPLVSEDHPAMEPETLLPRQTRSYTVVGFYERLSYELESYYAPGYTAFTLADQPMNGDFSYGLYFTMEEPQEVFDFVQPYQGDTNRDVLLFSGVTKFESFQATFGALLAIVIGLIMFGSVSLIYNAFSISVSERTKQFGLLSSIGATKKQLRKSVLFEAFVVSVIGIPLGIVVGIAGIGVTLKLIGGKFLSLGFQLPLSLSVSWLSVAVAVAVSIVTVLISAWIPSRRAMKVTAVEAIRLTQDVTTKNKKVKTSRLTYKLFGLPGVLASKHYKRNKKKYRATVISLFMSIVLFVSAAAFTGYLTESANGALEGNKFDLELYLEKQDCEGVSPQELLEILSGAKGITAAAFDRAQDVQAGIKKEFLTQEIIDSLSAYGYQPEYVPEDMLSFYTHLHFVDDGTFRQFLREQGLSEADYMNPEKPLAIAVDGNIHFDVAAQKYKPTNFLKGDACQVIFYAPKKIEGYVLSAEGTDENHVWFYEYRNKENPDEVLRLSRQEAFEEVTLTSGKTITERPWFLPSSQELTFLLPESALEGLFPGQDRYSFFFTSSDHTESYDALKEVLEGCGISAYSRYDNVARQEQERNLITIIQVFAYGFIVLISLIAAANVFNTISTNIGLRRREFAMLKSVGMTTGGFNKMMNYECLLYGSKALLYGLPVSGIIAWLMYEAVAMSFDNGFRLPWGAMGIATLSVFSVVFATMLYAMGKIKKDNPIDALKNENL